MNLRILLITSAVALLVACSKKTTEPLPPTVPTDTTSGPGGPKYSGPGISEPGYGKSTAGFKEPAWAPPAGITAAVHWIEYCPTDSIWAKKRNWLGTPNTMLFTYVVCIQLQNHTTNPITVRIPPTLTFESLKPDIQNGILLMLPAVVTVRPASTEVIYASLFCLNYKRHAPFDNVTTVHEWKVGPDKLPTPLQEVANIVGPKGITYKNLLMADGRTVDETKAKKMWMVQEAIWEITDDYGLTDSTRKKLRDLKF